MSVDLLPKMLELLFGDAPFEKGARIDARRGMPLEEDEIAAERFAGRAKEVIEADVVERRGRGKARDVAAEFGANPVCPDDRGQRVPADVVAQTRFDLAIAGHRRLFFEGGIVLTYGVVNPSDTCVPARRASSTSAAISSRARPGPSTASTARMASSHSRVSWGSGSGAKLVIAAVISVRRAHLFQKHPPAWEEPRFGRIESVRGS